MNPAEYAAKGTEHAHQTALFMQMSMWLTKWPELKWAFAVPNGGNRDPITAARLKAEGVKSGVSDVCLPIARQGYSGFYIEMKKPGGKESPQQKEFGAFVATQNYLYKCCTDWEDAANSVEWYMSCGN